VEAKLQSHHEARMVEQDSLGAQAQITPLGINWQKSIFKWITQLTNAAPLNALEPRVNTLVPQQIIKPKITCNLQYRPFCEQFPSPHLS
jgi:hypothetical protein